MKPNITMLVLDYAKYYRIIGVLALFGFISFLIIVSGCKKNDDDDFKAEFSIEYIDDNHVRFVNSSEGEYYSLIWNFGNGQSDTTTDKNKSYEIYYPLAGNYTVTLRLTNFTGNSQSQQKSVNIVTTDLLLSFTADIQPGNPNYVDLKNTSEGEYDSFIWLFRSREIENEMEYTAYFPQAGVFEIELQVIKDNITYSTEQSINISEDDPDYLQNLTLVWSDEFEGTAVDQDYWTYETGANGWGNEELQNYTSGDNAEVVDGKLIITAIKVDDNMVPGSYTSSRLVTENKKEFQYGRMEIRAKLPSGRGIWPAIWMLGSNFRNVGWPECGEMDIMEYVGYDPNVVHATVHTPSGFGTNGNGTSITLVTAEEEFHNYGLIWTDKRLEFYVDSTDNIIHTYEPFFKNLNNWPFDQPAFFILNIAVGGTWGGAQGIDNSIFPQTMEIDYVRVYQESD